jgi:uncharacterized protein YchJ
VSIFKSIIDYFTGYDGGVPTQLPERNELCWCGSGKKYKKCHLHEDEKKIRKSSASCGPA